MNLLQLFQRFTNRFGQEADAPRQRSHNRPNSPRARLREDTRRIFMS